MGHVREGEFSREVCPEAVLGAGSGRGVCHHHRLQHSGTVELASEDLRLQVGLWMNSFLIPLPNPFWEDFSLCVVMCLGLSGALQYCLAAGSLVPPASCGPAAGLPISHHSGAGPAAQPCCQHPLTAFTPLCPPITLLSSLCLCQGHSPQDSSSDGFVFCLKQGLLHTALPGLWESRSPPAAGFYCHILLLFSQRPVGEHP